MDKEIIEGNKTIARFTQQECVGILETGGNPLRAFYPADNIERYEKQGYVTQLSYHSDWAKLMPVVEKMEERGWFTTIQTSRCIIDTGTGYAPEFKRTGDSKINGVWLCVVAVLKWYNQQPK